ncbi:hypothetical protein [Vibrio alginolyticus]|uniref:hypothetical protein n=1 Tax=Vibrio alginolyticus TaxID=663 RepID=UPI0015F3BCDC|nr:hypothetical protein [Vibrio alginolyticus]EJE4208634.1 hypothetical protein [Vibrio parahaemolyticus]
MKNTIRSIAAVVCIVPSLVTATNNIENYAKEVAATSLSHVESVGVTELGEHRINVIVADQKCEVIIPQYDKDGPELQRLVVKSLTCKEISE